MEYFRVSLVAQDQKAFCYFVSGAEGQHWSRKNFIEATF